jgi:hypothetical protein
MDIVVPIGTVCDRISSPGTTEALPSTDVLVCAGCTIAPVDPTLETDVSGVLAEGVDSSELLLDSADAGLGISCTALVVLPAPFLCWLGVIV